MVNIHVGTSNSALTKYNTINTNGTVDNKTALDPEDDVAHSKLGGNWRMPTNEEWNELFERCECVWTYNYNRTGVKGRILTAANGNSIFLPAAGIKVGANLNDAGSNGYYWSSSLFMDTPYYAWRVYFLSGDVGRFGADRSRGQSVRPVSK